MVVKVPSFRRASSLGRVVACPPWLRRRQGLLGPVVVQLPGVQVGDDGLALAARQAAQQPVGEARQQAQVGAAGEGQVDPQHPGGRHRQHQQGRPVGAAGAGQQEGAARPRGLSVAGMVHGEERGVVGEAPLGQDPPVGVHRRGDREARRPVAGGAVDAGGGQGGQGAVQVGAEGVRGHPVDDRVVVAVAGDLVAGGGDAAHQSGMALGHAPQDEEGGAHPVGGQHLQAEDGRGLDPALPPGPGLGRRGLQVVVAVEPLLDVDGQDVGGRGLHDEPPRPF